jgi:membrane fusion protein (multidrug efflux system)
MTASTALGRVSFLLVVPLLAWGCGGDGAPPASGEASPNDVILVRPDDVTQVRVERLEGGIAFTGELDPIQTTRVTARFDGDLERVLVREGMRVRRGAPLAVYAPRDIRDALAAAEAEVAAADAAVAAAKNQEARARRLLDAGAAAPMDLEAAVATRSAAEARRDAAIAARNHAAEDAEKLDVPAPVSGWVSEVSVHDGDRTAVGDPLMVIVATDTLELAAALPSEALAEARPGTPIRFRLDAFPDREWEARIDRLNPTTVPGTRQVRLYARVPNPEGELVGGLFASGRIVTEVRENALAAPAAAVRTEGGKSVVYAIRDGKARRVEIHAGLLDEARGWMELEGEVAAGDSLLTGVLPGIRDGVPVRVLAGE